MPGLVNSSGPVPALDFAFPDPCVTPMGPVPTVIPYPNLTLLVTAIVSQFKVFLMCMPAHNLTTVKPMSMGDTPGVLLGVASGMVMGPARHAMGSTNVFMGGPPCTSLLCPTSQNGMSPNIAGMTLTISQLKTSVMR